MDFLKRALPLYGEGGTERLSEASVMVFGLGGVGAACAEALVRAGVGKLIFVDGDSYSTTNKNRQLYATEETLGKNKAAVAARRAKEINPAVCVEARECFYRPEDESFSFAGVDFVCDCIDDVEAKLSLMERTEALGVPLVSAMGAGGKLDPTRFRVARLSRTHTCPLAKKIRTLARARGLSDVTVVFSDEVSRAVTSPPASVSFVPPVMGFVMAGHAVRNLLQIED